MADFWNLMLVLICLSLGVPTQSTAQVKLPSGFSLRQVASDKLATNIFSMTIADDGRVFVSGPGYIKELIDSNKDGQFDHANIITTRIRSGAQGMVCEGKFLYAVGGQGVWRVDLNSPKTTPVRLLKIKTGGEHDAHAIRKGPFGWWYLIAGNGIPLRYEFHNSPTSPVKSPRAGILMRISPDFSQREIVAHGFRNAYDFDFSKDGRIFTYDSDGERDVSMPWYRPTRVFEIVPGDDAGWMSASWKHPNYFLDMPRVVGNAGRGSPTGVTVFDGDGFGKEFDQALFVADWTFGRILVSKQNGSTRHGKLELFATAEGDTGFAVTDIAQSRSGDLLVTVGGRGTRGGVFRITNDNKTKRNNSLGRLPAAKRYQIAEAKRFAPGPWSDANAQKLNLLQKSKNTTLNLAFDLVGRDLGPVRSLRLIPRKETESLVRFWHRYQSGLQKPYPIPSDALVKQLESATPESTLNLIRLLQLQVRGHAPKKKPTKTIGPPVLFGFLAESSKSKELLSEVPSLPTVLTNIMVAHSTNPKSKWSSRISREAARLLSMLQSQPRQARIHFAGKLTESSNPVEDLFWLSCLANATPKRETPFVVQKIALCLQKLETKMAQFPRDRNWQPRFRELVGRLVKNQQIACSIAGAPNVLSPGFAFLARCLPPQLQKTGRETNLPTTCIRKPPPQSKPNHSPCCPARNHSQITVSTCRQEERR